MAVSASMSVWVAKSVDDLANRVWSSPYVRATTSAPARAAATATSASVSSMHGL